jgi:ribonuclease P protein component
MSCAGPDEGVQGSRIRPLGRILKSVDFSQVLARPSTSRSPHFALHYSPTSPAVSTKAVKAKVRAKLSTEEAAAVDRPVDILCVERENLLVGQSKADVAQQPEARSSLLSSKAASVWIGLVVPKRHAKRSVTRTLMKRQIRVAFENVREQMRPGMWVVRLRAPFPKADFPSASSTVLKDLVRRELTSLVSQGVRPRDRTT